MREKRNTYEIFDGNPEGQIPLGKSSRRWYDNTKMDFRK
jgi:hypothetical protein